MIRQRDGIHFDLDARFVADARTATGDVNIVSHAHMDHAFTGDSDSVVCTPQTAALLSERTGNELSAGTHEAVELFPSGHILGSAAARITDDTGKRYLYTGDVATRDRCYLDGFEPVDADVLVIESTYGIPAYTFPDQSDIEQAIMDWVGANEDSPLFLYGYSLGRAQKLQWLVEQATDRPIIAHGSIHKMNQVIETVSDRAFRAIPYAKNKDMIENGVFVMPNRLARTDWVNETAEKYGAIKAGFSGWAATESFKYRGGYDTTFPLSDHCDFDDLVSLVKTVDPEKVYTHHGFDEAFASYLRSEEGINARPLKHNQSALDEF